MCNERMWYSQIMGFFLSWDTFYIEPPSGSTHTTKMCVTMLVGILVIPLRPFIVETYIYPGLDWRL